MELLETLKCGFQDNKTALICQVNSGLGGSGKTSLAVEYAHQHKEYYELIAFLDAETSAIWENSLLGLAEHLNLSGENISAQQAHHILKGWLATNNNWLLIADNADDQHVIKAILDSLPHPCQGHLLITSRNAKPVNVKNVVKVGNFTSEEAINFLLTRTDTDPQDEKLRQHAEILARELGYLPLALEQAAALIFQTGITFEGYLKEYRQRWASLLEEGVDYSMLEDPNAKQIAVTWNMNLQKISEKKPILRELLNLSAFMASETIPYEWISKGLSITEVNDFGQYNSIDAIKHLFVLLHNYSLIEMNENGYQLHRMVQAVIRHPFNKNLKESYIERCLMAFSHTCLLDLDRDIYFCHKELYIQGLSLSNLSTNLSASKILIFCASYAIKKMGDYITADSCLQSAQNIVESLSEPEFLAWIYNNRGDVYSNQGKYEEAIKYFDKSLNLKNKIDSLPLDIAMTLQNLGNCYYQLGQHDNKESSLKAANDYFQQALDIRRKSLKFVSEQNKNQIEREIAKSCVGLGSVCFALKQWENAKKFLKEAKNDFERLYGEDHPETAIIYNQLGCFYSENTNTYYNVSAAKTNHHKALKIRQLHLGEQHPMTASSYNYLGLLYQNQEPILAEKYYFNAFTALNAWILPSPLIKDLVNRILDNLRNLYWKQGLNQSDIQEKFKQLGV